MRLYTLHELLKLSRAELFALHQRITREMATMPPGFAERLIAEANLRSISRVLSRYDTQLL